MPYPRSPFALLFAARLYDLKNLLFQFVNLILSPGRLKIAVLCLIQADFAALRIVRYALKFQIMRRLRNHLNRFC